LILYFESHATSIDNVTGIASGHADPPLSPLGLTQAAEITARYSALSHVWCSDLERSWRTAEIAFGAHAPITRDARLREVHFGDLTRTSAVQIEQGRNAFLTTAYPNGESYEYVCHRIREFLDEIVETAEPQLIIGHRATWYALEHLLARRNLAEVVTARWQWQPGWAYEL
jgi:alpha-ribazole phosphatase/probable phosphoglycerate mutase